MNLPNEVLWIVLMLVNFLGILLAFRLFGKTGLYVWIAVASILANIQVIKTIELFGFVATLGNIIYGTTFLATDILNEVWGRKDANRSVWIGFFFLVTSMIIMQICLWFAPHPDDFAHPALSTIFGVFPRIVTASLVAYILSQFHDIWAYDFWRKKFPDEKFIFIRNNASTMVSQAIDSVIFCSIAFIGMFEWPVFWDILLTTYFLKWIVAACDTPFMYFAVKIKKAQQGGFRVD
jgi:uncharacterized integral membrane protein (TIGR00697 family)